MKPRVSIVLPTYNEAENIVRLVSAIRERVPGGLERQILVVDDNSPDGTYREVCEAFRDDPSVVPMLRTADRGLANSIRAGIEASSGDRIVILDTDFTHDPAEIPRILHLLEICDIVAGSRFCAGGGMEDTPHYLCSLGYNWFVRVVLRTQIQDNLSGYLGLRRTVLAGLPFDRIFHGYGDYCFRLLHYGQHAGARILELPVLYKAREKGASKSQFFKLLFSYTYALFKLRLDMMREPPFREPVLPIPSTPEVTREIGAGARSGKDAEPRISS